MKVLVVLLMIVITFSSSCKKDDAEVQPENSYDFDLINPTFKELQDFYNAGYTIINGNVQLSDTDSLEDMFTLSNVTSITGGFSVLGNDELISFNGLENLISINGPFSIGGPFQNQGNKSLKSLEGLDNLQILGHDFYIS